MEPFEVYAIKYAELKARPARDIFLSADLHEAPVDMDYFIWVARNTSRCFVIDSGFGPEVAAKRGRSLLRTPGEGLALLGIDPATVQDVIISHMHYDHVGNFEIFPQATFHLQDTEMSFATGRYMTHSCFSDPYELSDVLEMVKGVYQGRVAFHDGDDEIVPGLTVHLAPGHTAGLQFVRVHTRAGWLVLASDACHYNRHRLTSDVFPLVYDVGGLLENYKRLSRMATSERLVIPGHDPEVMRDFPAAAPELEGIVVRLD